MKKAAILTAIMILTAPVAVNAKHHLKGAVAGAAAGHMVGHGHAVAGAAAGAAIQHHHAKMKAHKTS